MAIDLKESYHNNQLCDSVALVCTFASHDNTGKVRDAGEYLIGTLPKGVIITKAYAIVDEPIGATSIDIGVVGTPEKYFADLTAATKGISVGTEGLNELITETVDVTATVDLGATPSNGMIQVIIEFINRGVRKEFYAA